jgi:peptide chain release factor subunit 3
MDDDSIKWSKDRYKEIKSNLSSFIKSCGFNIEKDIYWIPVSGLLGDNLKDVVNKNICKWYKGPSLIDILDKLELPKRDPKGPIRVIVLDIMKDRGIAVQGKI